MLVVDFPEGDGPVPVDPTPDVLDLTLAELAAAPAPDDTEPSDDDVADLVWEAERELMRAALADEAVGWAAVTGTTGWAPGTIDEALLRERVLAEVRDDSEVHARPVDCRPAPGWSDSRLVATVAGAERAVRYHLAVGVRATAELARRRPASSGRADERGLSAYALDELAVAAGVTRGAMAYRLAEAVELTQRLPRALDALQAGMLSPQAVRAIATATRPLSDEDARTVDVRLLDRVGGRTDPSLAELGATPLAAMLAMSDEAVGAVSLRATSTLVGRLARDLARRVDPAAARRREERARADRSVRQSAGEDGMGWFAIHGPEESTAAAYEYVDALARALPDDPDDVRTLDARRADVALDLLRGMGQRDGSGAVPVTNLEVLLDHTRCSDGGAGGCIGESGRLGQVTAETVAQLLDLVADTGGTVTGGHATWIDCPGDVVHAEQGPGPYVVPPPLKRLVRAHWRRCCFPGCARAARRCDADHTIPYPDGPTCICNLEPLCEHHHLLKHDRPAGHPGWQLVNHEGRSLTWITPTGRHIKVWPDAADPPDPAPQPDAEPTEPPPF